MYIDASAIEFYLGNRSEVEYILDVMVDVAGGSHVAGMEYLQEDRFEGGESEKEGTSESSFRLRVQRSTHTGKRHNTLYCLQLIPGRDGSAEVR